MMGGKRAWRASHGLIAVLVLLGVAVAALAGGWGGADRATAPSQHQARGPQDRAWGPSVGFANRDRLEDHFRKHGGEFGSITRQEYLRQAQTLRDDPAGGPILEAVRQDGVITRFDRRSGAFLAFNPDGVIRTFFRPNDGERYFHRQLDRGR